MTDVSIIINNYNYGKYVGAAIGSALDQREPAAQVIVVDDGSTDDSPAVINRFGDDIVYISKANGGQASALNAGFDVARGDAVIFLDADDLLLDDAVRRVRQIFDEEPALAKAAWPMLEIDAEGRRTGRRHPDRPVDHGDCLATLASRGPFNICTPPTSGNAFSRNVLERLMPMPADRFRTCADGYLLLLAPLYGPIARIDQPLSGYRVHGANALSGTNEFQRVARLWQNNLTYQKLLADHLSALSIPFDASRWRTRNGYLEHVLRLGELIEQTIAPGEAFVLIDEGRFNVGRDFKGRHRRYLMETNGTDAGPPADDASLEPVLEAHLAAGVTGLFVTDDCSWWVDHYTDLRRFLEKRGYRIADDVSAWRFSDRSRH